MVDDLQASIRIDKVIILGVKIWNQIVQNAKLTLTT